MATSLHTNATGPDLMARTTLQKVCIGMGIFFVAAGIIGIIMPGFLGMHLSLAHNIIHLASGSLAIWCGYRDTPKTAQNFAVGFGVVYGLLGIWGFVSGTPGFPGLGHLEADQNLLRIIPNALEFGTMDHSVHILISAVFLLSALFLKSDSDVISRTAVDVQRGTFDTAFRNAKSDPSNFDRNLKDMDLGESDVQRKSDYNRREDFERRI